MTSNNDDNAVVQGNLEGTEKVFGNDLLLDIILTYAIYGQRNIICGKNLSSVRLVEKRWLETVSGIVRKSKGRIYSIQLNVKNSLNRSESVQTNGKELDKFTSLFKSKNHLEISLLPASIYTISDFFRAENYFSLLSYFTKCGQHLKTLDIEFPANGGSMPLSFPPFTLPNLNEIRFEFTDTNLLKEQVYGDNRNGISLLQSLLNASISLKRFHLAFFDNSNKFVPFNYEYISIPETVTSIILEDELTIKNVELLLQNKLPLLQDITLILEDSDVGNSSLFRVLDHFRKTLKFLTLERGDKSMVNFPLMERLEVLQLICSLPEVDARSSDLRKCMPKLKKIVVNESVESWITKFANIGGFPSVEEIDINLEDETEFVNYGLMASLHTAFPNLQKLSMSIHVNEMTGLKYVAGHLKQLKTLEITFSGKVRSNTRKQIETVFLGLPKKTKQPSIMNLSELRKLHLTSNVILKDGESSLLTDSLFQQGLKEMKKLQMLLLSGKFKPPTEMQEEWRKQGRFIEYRKGMEQADDKIRNPFKF